MTRMNMLSRLARTGWLWLVALLVLPAAAGAFEAGVGVHVGLGWYDAERVRALTAELPISSMRDELPWSEVETADGRFEVTDAVRRIDALVDLLQSRQQSLVLILGYGHPRHTPNGLVDSQAARQAFGRYAQWVAQRYGKRVKYFEVWNEWNAGMGSTLQPRPEGKVDDYVALLRHVYPLIKAQAPQAKVLGAGIAGTGQSWLKDFVRLGGLASLDGLSVHPYVHFKRHEGLPELSIDWLDWAHGLVAQNSRRELPFYVTEIGWPASEGAEGYAEQRVAAYLTRFYALAATRPWIAGAWWYTLLDDGDDPKDKEHRFGLVPRPAGAAPRLAFESLRNMAEWTRQGRSWREEKIGGGRRVVRFEAGQPHALVWSERLSSRMVIRADGPVKARPYELSVDTSRADTPLMISEYPSELTSPQPFKLLD